MSSQSDLQHNKHCIFNLHVHLVFVTKYRKRVLTKAMLNDMRPIFELVCNTFDAQLVEFDGENNHVHLLITYPPKLAISQLVNNLKGISSRMIREKHYLTLKQKLWRGSLWSPSYFAASCGGAPISIIRQYIEQQKTPE